MYIGFCNKDLVHICVSCRPPRPPLEGMQSPSPRPRQLPRPRASPKHARSCCNFSLLVDVQKLRSMMPPRTSSAQSQERRQISNMPQRQRFVSCMTLPMCCIRSAYSTRGTWAARVFRTQASGGSTRSCLIIYKLVCMLECILSG